MVVVIIVTLCVGFMTWCSEIYSALIGGTLPPVSISEVFIFAYCFHRDTLSSRRELPT